MFSLFFEKKYIFLYIFSILLVSCNKNQPVSAKAYRGTQNSYNYLAYLTKIEANQSVKIACDGTSLTYGQNVPGVLPPINGASQYRALYQYPSSLQIALRAVGINALVINRGFPGDRTTESLIRWRDSTIADVCILEYGTNDAFNFAGYSSGQLTIPAFTDSLSKIVKRRLDQGTWVIITSPPDINPPDTVLNSYKTAI
jgi:lysophospholipase L1-like esterase